MKILYLSKICLLALVFVVAAVAFLPRKISGENTMAGCIKCLTHGAVMCGSLPDQTCSSVRNACKGTSENKYCYPDEEGTSSNCDLNKNKCKSGANGYCG